MPQEAIMVGDWAERDMKGAKALGITTVFARYGDDFNTKDPAADFEAADPDDILKIVDKLNVR
jgi:FMN phosphatase YigB (HAD superfamily)